jgi:hypothetical protein
MNLSPVVLADDTLVCDGPGSHEIRVITDGRKAYAYGLARGASDAGPAHRDGVVITVDCNQPGRDDEPCSGQVRLDLTAAAVWVDAAPLLDLFRFGSEVEV